MTNAQFEKVAIAYAYNDVAEMTRVVDEAIAAEDAAAAVAERAAVWSSVASTEDDYDLVCVKCDGREG